MLIGSSQMSEPSVQSLIPCDILKFLTNRLVLSLNFVSEEWPSKVQKYSRSNIFFGCLEEQFLLKYYTRRGILMFLPLDKECPMTLSSLYKEISIMCLFPYYLSREDDED
jgi:hypothetical protein